MGIYTGKNFLTMVELRENASKERQIEQTLNQSQNVFISPTINVYNVTPKTKSIITFK